jgi:hypothetical protein
VTLPRIMVVGVLVTAAVFVAVVLGAYLASP